MSFLSSRWWDKTKQGSSLSTVESSWKKNHGVEDLQAMAARYDLEDDNSSETFFAILDAISTEAGLQKEHRMNECSLAGWV